MSGTWKDGAQKGVYGVQDDLRHTYEQVFWGRQTTGNNAADLPEADPEKKEEVNYPFHPKDGEILPPEPAAGSAPIQPSGPIISPDMDPIGRAPTAQLSGPDSIDAEDLYGPASSGPSDGGGFYGSSNVAQISDADELYGLANAPDPGAGGGVHGPSVEAPTTDADELYGPADAPTIAPPSQGNDLTPDY
jgi:hypothetical protein